MRSKLVESVGIKLLLILAMVAGVSALTAPTAASAAPGQRATSATRTVVTRSSPVVPLANSCNFPTQAHAHSVWVPPSYSSCNTCSYWAAFYNSESLLYYYCTYNPSNNKNDLHYDL